MNKNTRLLIFLVTYNAQKHILSVLKRIPECLFNDYDTQILVIDDASCDNTINICLEFAREYKNKITVLRNPKNQGYGGNQKIGYTYALNNNFDIVVLLHGDEQYPPEKIPELVEPLVSGNISAVFGSRMINKAEAIRGRMPLYKYFANIVLTSLQNKILNTKLSEFHCGLRAYRCDILNAIPFSYNSNGFDFDTDIIIQIVISGKKILEIPIPTRYADEICRVNGFQYAYRIICASILSRIQNIGIYYHPKFDIELDDLYPSKLNFDSSHSWAIEQVSQNACVMDIGGASGHIAKTLVHKNNAIVYGYDRVLPKDSDTYKSFQKLNLDTDKLIVPEEKVDYVLLLDVLEHLENPEKTLDYLRHVLQKDFSAIILTTGNVAFFLVRLSLLFGGFRYGKRGILDRTHKRLFTFSSLISLLEQHGYAIEKVHGIPAPFILAVGDSVIGRTLLNINNFLIKIWRNLFSYQIAVVCRPLPNLETLLKAAQKT